MALTYEFDNQIKALAPVLDDYAEWFGRVVRRLFYSEKYDDLDSLPIPQSFEKWADYALREKAIDPAKVERLRSINRDLHRAASDVALQVLNGKGRPDLKPFDLLLDIYEEFILHLRRLERDSAFADSGMDGLTGLRSSKAMDRDLERELERRSRRGKPFCLVVARIDDFPALRQKMTIEQAEDVVRAASVLIKKCIRSFDDAYRSQDAEFVMALKHADTVGGTAAIARLKGFLEETPVIAEIDGGAVPITMSYCAAEPVPGDKIDALLDNMRDDLSQCEDSGSALEYIEQSPLARFIHSGTDDV